MKDKIPAHRFFDVMQRVCATGNLDMFKVLFPTPDVHRIGEYKVRNCSNETTKFPTIPRLVGS